MESQSRLHKRNLRKRGPENADNKASKRKQMNDILFFYIANVTFFFSFNMNMSLTFFFLLLRPALIFRLKDEDIHSDMQAMRSVSIGKIQKGKK